MANYFVVLSFLQVLLSFGTTFFWLRNAYFYNIRLNFFVTTFFFKKEKKKVALENKNQKIWKQKMKPRKVAVRISENLNTTFHTALLSITFKDWELHNLFFFRAPSDRGQLWLSTTSYLLCFFVTIPYTLCSAIYLHKIEVIRYFPPSLFFFFFFFFFKPFTPKGGGNGTRGCREWKWKKRLSIEERIKD